MIKNINENPLFYNSLILFSDENMHKIQNARIALAGIGGVGSIALEMLVRQGINNIKIADNDVYEEINMNRQIFATYETIGKNKTLAAKERILSINPDCNIKTYEEGVTPDNVEDFCSDTDVILSLLDSEATKVLMHKVAKKNKIPCVMGSRKSIDGNSRWCVFAHIWDYKNNPNLQTFGETNHPKLEKYKISDLTSDILKNYDEQIKQKKINIFKKNSENLQNTGYFKTISQQELAKKLSTTKNAYNRHVCAVIANTAGCLAASVTIRYILGLNTNDELSIELM